MRELDRQERFLIALALVLCAVIVGYNAFFVPSTSAPTTVTVWNGEDPTASSPGNPAEGSSSSDGGKVYQTVNLNTADAQTLATSLPGVGEVIAHRIVEYREANGPFSSIEEIKNVSGIGDKTYEKLRPYLTI